MKLGRSKATRYQGDGKYKGVTVGGVMFAQPLTEEDEQAEKVIQKRYGQYLSDFTFVHGENKGKPLWLIRFEDGTECETTEGPFALCEEIEKLLKRHNIDFK